LKILSNVPMPCFVCCPTAFNRQADRAFYRALMSRPSPRRLGWS
jgi:hypothetical protein